MFEFGWPWAFWFLPLPLIIIFFLPPIKQKRSSLAVPFFKEAVSISGQKPQKGVFVSKRSVTQYIVMWIVWVLLTGALASPQLVGEPELKVKTARNLLLLIDLSASMTTKDWVVDNKRTTRWEAVKQVMREFIEKREGDRLGLVLFATQPYLQVPFTADLQVVQNYLLESIEFEEESYRPATLLYYYPLLAAFVLVIIYHLLKGTFTFIRNGKLVKKTT